MKTEGQASIEGIIAMATLVGILTLTTTLVFELQKGSEHAANKMHQMYETRECARIINSSAATGSKATGSLETRCRAQGSELFSSGMNKTIKTIAREISTINNQQAIEVSIYAHYG